MDLNIISLVINGLLMIALYFMKTAHSDIKEQLKEHRLQLGHLKENKMDKIDFKEFKDELWIRLDRFEGRMIDLVKDK